MKRILASLLILAASPALADGDAEKGAKVFNKCKSCHTIASADAVIVRGGKVGPNLYGVVGRPLASQEGFNYGAGIKEAAEKVPAWTQDEIAAYVQNPTGWLDEVSGDAGAKSKMTFKLPKEDEAEDVAAYLASLAN